MSTPAACQDADWQMQAAGTCTESCAQVGLGLYPNRIGMAAYWRGAEVSKYAPRFRLLRYTGPFRLASGTSKMTRNRPIALSPARIIRPAAQFDEDAIWRVIEPVFRAGETYPLPRDISRLPIGARRATRCSSRRSEDGS
jgi:hypothetical protein